jgi:Fe2+ transport system protein FeoA
MLQLSSNREAATHRRLPAGAAPPARLYTLADLRKGSAAILDRIDLPADDARRLMELGFVPGNRIVAGCRAPGGDPRVFQVDGSEIALRRETAARISVHIEVHRKK